jgi:hypothetical protein
MSTLWQYIGTVLNGAAAVTAIAPADRISHGLRPQQKAGLPAVNYFRVAEVAHSPDGVAATVDVQISARAKTALQTEALSDAISGVLVNRIIDSAAGFDVQKIEFGSRGPLIPEPEIDAFHIPLTVRCVLRSALT